VLLRSDFARATHGPVSAQQLGSGISRWFLFTAVYLRFPNPQAGDAFGFAGVCRRAAPSPGRSKAAATAGDGAAVGVAEPQTVGRHWSERR
jgi:hypothetical protein